MENSNLHTRRLSEQNPDSPGSPHFPFFFVVCPVEQPEGPRLFHQQHSFQQTSQENRTFARSSTSFGLAFCLLAWEMEASAYTCPVSPSASGCLSTAGYRLCPFNSCIGRANVLEGILGGHTGTRRAHSTWDWTECMSKGTHIRSCLFSLLSFRIRRVFYL